MKWRSSVIFQVGNIRLVLNVTLSIRPDAMLNVMPLVPEHWHGLLCKRTHWDGILMPLFSSIQRLEGGKMRGLLKGMIAVSLYKKDSAVILMKLYIIRYFFN